mgnify:FL=1
MPRINSSKRTQSTSAKGEGKGPLIAGGLTLAGVLTGLLVWRRSRARARPEAGEALLVTSKTPGEPEIH